ncbi:uncharacterized protein BJ171DRAFT_477236 [Polychytrium aggregatum]|uniref:uncharacterized protein n=1 Tax=Polychytrium aggregatum TaxID=110093 RepID=UPI0022FDDFFB|nr:uncharacterized protein BJ171DRAFT_477236 [Polychytrium aggregatum]KAI9199789.1 hypothetical protein BJ171DRAFT_477236 [Polychytrium aggregatum]
MVATNGRGRTGCVPPPIEHNEPEEFGRLLVRVVAGRLGQGEHQEAAFCARKPGKAGEQQGSKGHRGPTDKSHQPRPLGQLGSLAPQRLAGGTAQSGSTRPALILQVDSVEMGAMVMKGKTVEMGKPCNSGGIGGPIPSSGVEIIHHFGGRLRLAPYRQVTDQGRQAGWSKGTPAQGGRGSHRPGKNAARASRRWGIDRVDLRW